EMDEHGNWAVGAEDAEREAAWAEYYEENPDAIPGDESGDVPTSAPVAGADAPVEAETAPGEVAPAEAEEAPEGAEADAAAAPADESSADA
ncbi:MAG: hypothetical protein ABIR32_10630, partial [Ilumatobacteraceae bacterium]